MQEETPLAPAQTMRLVILLPQNFLQLVLDRRGRAACCSLSGVLASGRAEWVVSNSSPALPAASTSCPPTLWPLTVVFGQAPARGGTQRPRREVVRVLRQAHRGHGLGEAGGRGQLQQGDVVVDGEHIELGVLENLWGGADSHSWGLGRSQRRQNQGAGLPLIAWCPLWTTICLAQQRLLWAQDAGTDCPYMKPH